MSQSILIFNSRILCYDSNRMFIDEMSKELQELGYIVELCEIDPEDEACEEKLEAYIGKGFQAMIDFNSILPRLQMDSGERYLDLIDAPFYNYIVDHPLYHHPVIKLPLKNSNIICIDKKHCQYIMQHYPNIRNTVFMPIGGMKALSDIPYEQRSHEVLFTGTYASAKQLEEEMNQSNWKEEMNLLLEKLCGNPKLTQEEALLEVLNEAGEQLSSEEFANRLNSDYRADRYLRAYYREQVIEVLLENGIDVTVYGHGWEHFETKHKEHLKIHNEVSFPVSLELIADSKILLNIMPWFKGGIHDRVLSAMVNKTVCISDTNEYLEENFVEGENILLYCFDHLEALPEKINHLLSNPMKAKEIAECGYEEAITHHMWKNRIEETIHKIR